MDRARRSIRDSLRASTLEEPLLPPGQQDVESAVASRGASVESPYIFPPNLRRHSLELPPGEALPGGERPARDGKQLWRIARYRVGASSLAAAPQIALYLL